MSQKEFENALLDKLPAHFPATTFEVRDVAKLQGQSYTGLTVKPEGSMIAPTMNIEALFRKYGAGEGLTDDAIEGIVSEIRDTLSKTPMVDLSMTEWEKARHHLRYQLIPIKGNEALLENTAHKSILDLALVIRLEFFSNSDGCGTALVTRALQKTFDKTDEELFAAALDAATKEHPASLRNITEVLFGPLSNETDEKGNLWVASTNDGRDGAAVLAYPGFLKECAEKLHSDLVILPSSVHEVLVLPDNGEMTVADLKNMVKSVNETELNPEDFLSDNVYYYNNVTEELTMAG